VRATKDVDGTPSPFPQGLAGRSRCAHAPATSTVKTVHGYSLMPISRNEFPWPPSITARFFRILNSSDIYI